MYLLITKKTKSGNYAVTVVEATPIGDQKLAFGVFLTTDAKDENVGKKFEIKGFSEKILKILDQHTGEITETTQIIPRF